MTMAAPIASVRSGPRGLRWLVDHAWPLWLEHGVDWERGAFHEHLDSTSLACGTDFRRLRVAARQTYVFAKAATHAVPRAAQAVVLGLEFLRNVARLEDGGYARRFDLANKPIDLTRDLYDHAFVLLAFSAAAAVVGPDAVRGDATALADYVARQFQHPHGGYEESFPVTRPRRQNPHMHLFEALLASHEAFGDDIFFGQAQALADLFLGHFFQTAEDALPEYFDEALKPVRESGRFLIEPGHHYEWIWLLDRYAERAAALGKVVPAQLRAASDALLGFADRHGVSRDFGLVVNQNWSDGAVHDGGFRLWPQTERLKAEARRKDSPSRHLGAAMHAFERHFTGVPPGLWIERFDARGNETREPAPASSLYHLTAALTDDAVRALVD
jgi:mannose/cellobiose epimerase-like protein (N-acyl-D-glucosamine 2-epimerase family)